MFGLLHAVLTVPLGLSQHVTGIGITLLATSLTYFTYRLLLPEVTSPPKIEPFQPLPIPGLSSIPVVGEALFSQTPLTYLAFVCGRRWSPGCSTARRSGWPSRRRREPGRGRGAGHRRRPACASAR